MRDPRTPTVFPTVEQMERMGLVRCVADGCTTFVEPRNVLGENWQDRVGHIRCQRPAREHRREQRDQQRFQHRPRYREGRRIAAR